jgi:hypothetical protein
MDAAATRRGGGRDIMRGRTRIREIERGHKRERGARDATCVLKPV